MNRAPTASNGSALEFYTIGAYGSTSERYFAALTRDRIDTFCDIRARRGEFDGVVAMYHDQGHIALKLLGGTDAVNISAGLPIVRTSVAHGTAYDIAGKGVADAGSLVAAARVAALLAGPEKR